MGALKIFDGTEYKPVGVTINQTINKITTGGDVAGVTIDKIYPVGAVYISTVATNPADLFGFGTWAQIEDTFLLAAGKSYEAGATGGEATHTLTIDEMPSHTHTTNMGTLGAPQGSYNMVLYNSSSGSLKSNSTGGSQPHNNMPPYLAVYMWQRIA